MAQPEFVAVTTAEEVVLQVEAQVAVRGRTSRLETEAGLLGMDVEVRDITMTATDRHRRGNELILIPRCTRIGDGIQLGVAADTDHRVSTRNGEEALQIRIGRAGRTVRSRRGGGRIGHRFALRQHRLCHARYLGGVQQVGSAGRRDHGGGCLCCSRRNGCVALLKAVQTLLHALQRLPHGRNLTTQRLRVLLVIHLCIRRRDRQCCHTGQAQYRHAHCILPGRPLFAARRQDARMRHSGLVLPLLEMRILRRRHRPACAWQATGR